MCLKEIAVENISQITYSLEFNSFFVLFINHKSQQQWAESSLICKKRPYNNASTSATLGRKNFNKKKQGN